MQHRIRDVTDSICQGHPSLRGKVCSRFKAAERQEATICLSPTIQTLQNLAWILHRALNLLCSCAVGLKVFLAYKKQGVTLIVGNVILNTADLIFVNKTCNFVYLGVSLQAKLQVT